jgi:hypothetical protein
LNLLIAMLAGLCTAALWFGILIFGEPLLLEGVVAPAAGVDIQGWLDEFLRSQFYAVALAITLALLWHLTASGCSGRHSDRRLWWSMTWIMSLLTSIVLCALLLPDTQEGIFWAYLLALINGVVPFWLGTVWCTPGACKYAPLGAGRMRSVFGL